MNIVWCITGTVGNFLSYSLSWDSYKNLCQTAIFMILRFSGEIVTVIFAIIGIIITIDIKKLPHDTIFEKRTIRKQK